MRMRVLHSTPGRGAAVASTASHDRGSPVPQVHPGSSRDRSRALGAWGLSTRIDRVEGHTAAFRRPYVHAHRSRRWRCQQGPAVEGLRGAIRNHRVVFSNERAHEPISDCLHRGARWRSVASSTRVACACPTTPQSGQCAASPSGAKIGPSQDQTKTAIVPRLSTRSSRPQSSTISIPRLGSRMSSRACPIIRPSGSQIADLLPWNWRPQSLAAQAA